VLQGRRTECVALLACLEVARERQSGALVLRRGAGVAETRGQLTAREVRSRDSLATACRNPEIGARLFISPRTVEYHLQQGLHQARDQLAQPARPGPPE
jgi:DNA-binding CsgD family transcriptional regulator